MQIWIWIQIRIQNTDMLITKKDVSDYKLKSTILKTPIDNKWGSRKCGRNEQRDREEKGKKKGKEEEKRKKNWKERRKERTTKRRKEEEKN